MLDRMLVLTGFMGSGKSSVGKAVAERLGVRFIDLDAEIVATAGRSINDIFAQEGEQAFRVMESSLLEKVLTSGDACVLATGGGAVVSGKNRSQMRERGIVVNLAVTLDQVIERLKDCRDRPLMAGDDVVKRTETLMAAREQFYADADIRIDTDGKSVEDVAIEILCRLKGFLSECAVR